MATTVVTDRVSRVQVFLLTLLLAGCVGVSSAFAQSESAHVSGRVTDQTNSVIIGAEVEVKDVDTGLSQVTETNSQGVYAFAFLKPGRYMITVRKSQFRTMTATGITLNAQDSLSRNFMLEVGSSAESVTVTANAMQVNTVSATVATVVDRQFIENIPLNGRSLQSLITLVPGAVTTPSNSNTTGQFSVNGQRSSANAFSVDGVSANTNAGTAGNGGLSGNLPGLTTAGTTQSLVSVDALQEFKVQTSTYSAEFGTKPGAQVSMVTRSGTNQFHGNVFEYLRNEKFDANNWFANRAGTAKPPERQNDFGGTFGGPVAIPGVYNGRDRTFFFFSYEGLRLKLPQFTLSNVPSVTLRQTAPPAVRPILNAFPMPNGRDLGNGLAEFSAGYSDPSSLDATSIKLNHQFDSKLSLFVRFNKSPSETSSRSGNNLAQNATSRFDAQTITVGATSMLTTKLSNELRVNWSQNEGTISQVFEDFSGAIPPPRSAVIPPDIDPGVGAAGSVVFTFAGRSSPAVTQLGLQDRFTTAQHQFNLVDAASFTAGSHQFKFGVDFRRLTPVSATSLFNMNAQFLNAAQVLAGVAPNANVGAGLEMHPVFTNLSLYAQDNWRLGRRLSVNLGVRWEYNPAPTEGTGKDPVVVDQIDDLTTTKLAPTGTPQWQTTYDNFAPRLGAAYVLRERPGRETVLRGGVGLYYDTGNDLGAQNIGQTFPYRSNRNMNNLAFPYTAAEVAPTPVPVPLIPRYTTFFGFDPHLKLPYTWQWNVAVEQALGANQSLSVTYVGSSASRLLQLVNQSIATINPLFTTLSISRNSATADYKGLQLQFQRRLSHGLQALVSYSWSHAIDEDSTSSTGFVARRGDAAFDVRHVGSYAVTYDIPAPRPNAFVGQLLGNWSIDTTFHAQSASPFDLTGLVIINPIDGSFSNSRPNIVPGVPWYVDDPLVPGGRRINRDAFTAPPAGTSGNLGRNALRGFSAWQQDLAIRKEFPVQGGVKVQFRAEGFNIFNHPNFGGIQRTLTAVNFGQATQMLNTSLGGLSPLYQIGGPRSFQFALKVIF